jgi:hypothetical protein
MIFLINLLNISKDSSNLALLLPYSLYRSLNISNNYDEMVNEG